MTNNLLNKLEMSAMRACCLVLICALFFSFLLHASLGPSYILTWLTSHTLAWLLNVILIVFGLTALGLLLNSLRTMLVVSFFVMISLSTVQYRKVQLLGEPLYLSDFQHLRYLNKVAFLSKEQIYFLLPILTSFVVWILFRRLNFSLRPATRKLLTVLTFGLLFVSYFLFHTHSPIKQALISKVYNYGWHPLGQHQKIGSVLSWFTDYLADGWLESTNYNSRLTQEFIEHQLANYPHQPQTLTTKPNIVLLVSEALWDVKQIEGLSCNPDPLLNLNSLESKSTWRGNFVSPVRGGKTADVEFELLTSFSTRFLLPGHQPFLTLGDKASELPALPRLLIDTGYTTLAIHPYHHSFYKRSTIYSKFGFDTFISEREIKHSSKRGRLISDQSLFEEIYDQLKNAHAPTFIHAVSIQNHHPFDTLLSTDKIELKTTLAINANQREELIRYCAGIRASDLALAKWAEKILALETPTILIVLGDHPPTFANQLFDKLPPSPDQELKRSLTPLVILSNYSLDLQSLSALQGAQFLMPNILHRFRIPISPYLRTIIDFTKVFTVITQQVVCTTKAECTLDSISKQDQEVLNRYQDLQFFLITNHNAISAKFIK